MAYAKNTLRDMIPLYLAGRLSQEEAETFLEQLADYPELERELMEFSLLDVGRQDDADPADFDNLFHKIDARIRHGDGPAPAQSAMQERFTRWLRRPVFPWGLALLQSVLLAGLIAWQLNPSLPGQDAPASNAMGDRPRATTMYVVFHDAATSEEIVRLLRDLQLSIIAGPSPNNSFVVASRKAESDIQQQLLRLKSSPPVRFVERTTL